MRLILYHMLVSFMKLMLLENSAAAAPHCFEQRQAARTEASSGRALARLLKLLKKRRASRNAAGAALY